jgi:hypothetical protein
LDIGSCDRWIDEQLQLLADAFLSRESKAGGTVVPAQEPAVEPVVDKTATEEDGQAEANIDTPAAAETAVARRKRADGRQAGGYVPQAKSMEEKLRDARRPIGALLTEDCVQLGLLSKKQAGQLVAGMAGNTGEQAEQEIVEQLRQILQTQVKSFIRKAKGGPWRDPRVQEDLRQDIHAARSIRSVLMLARQVVKEYQAWQEGNQRGGLLGLFSQRRRLV